MEFKGVWKIKDRIHNVDSEEKPPNKYENTLHAENKETTVTKKPISKKRTESLTSLILGEKLSKKIRINPKG